MNYNLKTYRSLFIVYSLSFIVILCGCHASFSFSGASIPPDAKTFSVQYFQNQAPLAGPTVQSTMTDALRNYISSHSKLNLETDGNLDFKGAVTGYTTAPATASGANTGVSASTRLTITVEVTYTDKNDPKKSFDASFSRYADFPSATNFVTVQADLITQIENLLVQDIFDKAFNNW